MSSLFPLRGLTPGSAQLLSLQADLASPPPSIPPSKLLCLNGWAQGASSYLPQTSLISLSLLSSHHLCCLNLPFQQLIMPPVFFIQFVSCHPSWNYMFFLPPTPSPIPFALISSVLCFIILWDFLLFCMLPSYLCGLRQVCVNLLLSWAKF